MGKSIAGDGINGSNIFGGNSGGIYFKALVSQDILGWPKNSFRIFFFSVRCYGKTQMNFLANQIHLLSGS